MFLQLYIYKNNFIYVGSKIPIEKDYILAWLTFKNDIKYSTFD